MIVRITFSTTELFFFARDARSQESEGSGVKVGSISSRFGSPVVLPAVVWGKERGLTKRLEIESRVEDVS